MCKYEVKITTIRDSSPILQRPWIPPADRGGGGLVPGEGAEERPGHHAAAVHGTRTGPSVSVCVYGISQGKYGLPVNGDRNFPFLFSKVSLSLKL